MCYSVDGQVTCGSKNVPLLLGEGSSEAGTDHNSFDFWKSLQPVTIQVQSVRHAGMSKGTEQTPSIGNNFLTCQKFPKVPPWLSAVTRATSSANAWQLQSLRASIIGADGPASLEHRLAFWNSTESSDPGVYNYGKHHPLDLVLCGVSLG